MLQIGDELHLWANEVFHGINHYVSALSDPFNFALLEETVILPGAVRGHAMIDSGKVILFYEQYQAPLYHSSEIHWIESEMDGNWNWSEPTFVLKSELEWEKIGTKRVGSPYVYYD